MSCIQVVCSKCNSEIMITGFGSSYEVEDKHSSAVLYEYTAKCEGVELDIKMYTCPICGDKRIVQMDNTEIKELFDLAIKKIRQANLRKAIGTNNKKTREMIGKIKAQYKETNGMMEKKRTELLQFCDGKEIYINELNEYIEYFYIPVDIVEGKIDEQD